MKFYQSCLGTVTKLTMRRGEDQYNEIIEHFFLAMYAHLLMEILLFLQGVMQMGTQQK